MNEIDKAKLEQFVGDKELFSAIYKFIQEFVGSQIMTADVNKTTNELLGQQFRAYCMGKELLKGAFVEMNKFKKVEPIESKINPAR